MSKNTEFSFPEYVSSFLKKLINELTEKYGTDSHEVQSITRQYYKQKNEDIVLPDESDRHYHADNSSEYNGIKLRGVERLYKRCMVIEPTTVCAAHCRYCLRSHYDRQHLDNSELKNIAQFCGDMSHNPDLRELLITGGDPFMIPTKLSYFINCIAEFAPNIEIIRIGTRIPMQDPQRINEDLLEALHKRQGIKFEVSIQINSVHEFTDEASRAIEKLENIGCKIYCQTVLLKGVNDTVEDMVELYDKLRYLWIEPHYIFHCVPIMGMGHLRTSVEKGLEIIRDLDNSGKVSGRAKPHYALMTDVGKVMLYEGTIVKNEENMLLLKTSYDVNDRLKWNPDWEMPSCASIDTDGKILVWYKNGE
jgi:lysine 2,3-aminomutase